MPSSSSPGRFARRQVLEENEDEFQAAIQKGDLEGLEARWFGAMPSYNTSRLHHARRSSEGGGDTPRGPPSLEARFGAMSSYNTSWCVTPEGATSYSSYSGERGRARRALSLSLSLSRARAANRIDADYLLLLWRSSSSSL